MNCAFGMIRRSFPVIARGFSSETVARATLYAAASSAPAHPAIALRVDSEFGEAGTAWSFTPPNAQTLSMYLRSRPIPDEQFAHPDDRPRKPDKTIVLEPVAPSCLIK
jgi:hypothetical protein